MMRVDEEGCEQQRTLWCGNISDQVSDEVLYELFLQAGPVESVRRPRDPNGRPKSFAFILYKHECSVPYALELFRGEKLFNRPLNLSSRSQQYHIPVLDTHLSEFTEPFQNKPRKIKEGRNHRNDRRQSDKERDDKEPTSWAELNSLRGKGLMLNGHWKSDDKRGTALQFNDERGTALQFKESKPQDVPPSLSDFERLLQMGSQMMPNMISPGMFGGIPSLTGGPINFMGPNLGPMGLNMNPIGSNMYPSMQGEMSGGTFKKRFSPERERGRQGRDNRRDHPYQDRRQESQYDNRRHSDNNYNHRRHDRGYSSSRSSHERERRDRRSR